MCLWVSPNLICGNDNNSIHLLSDMLRFACKTILFYYKLDYSLHVLVSKPALSLWQSESFGFTSEGWVTPQGLELNLRENISEISEKTLNYFFALHKLKLEIIPLCLWLQIILFGSFDKIFKFFQSTLFCQLMEHAIRVLQ